MKKVKQSLNKPVFLLLCILFIIFQGTATAKQSEDISITGILVEDCVVTAQGNISSNEKSRISILALDPNNDIIFMDQISSDDEGNFDIEFDIKNKTLYGEYTLKISGYGVSQPEVRYFEYLSAKPQGRKTIEINSLTTTDDGIILNGVISGKESARVSAVVYSQNKNIVCMDQIKSSENGEFNIELKILDDSYGKYSVRVGGDKVNSPVVEYFYFGTENKPEQMIKEKIASGYFDFRVIESIPTITGKIKISQGKHMSLHIIDSANNAVVAERTFDVVDEQIDFTYNLFEIDLDREYIIELQLTENNTALASLYLEMDMNGINPDFYGEVEFSDNINIDANFQSIEPDLINVSTEIVDGQRFSYSTQNSEEFKSCNMSFVCHEMVEAAEDNKTYAGNHSREVALGECVNIYLNLENVANISAKEITVTYDPLVLEVTDMYNLTYDNELSAGVIEQTNTEIKSISNGSITYKLTDTGNSDENVTGTILGISFKGLADTSTQIGYTIENDE